MSYLAKPKVAHPKLPRNKLGLTQRDYEGAVSTLCAGCGHDSVTAALIQAVFEKLFVRFPNLRVGSVENGSDFLGPMFRKMDQVAKKNYWWFDDHPVDTFKQHVWMNPFWEDDVDEVVELMGADRVIFGSDWPHIEGMPQPLDYLVELKNLTPEQTKQVMLDNVMELNSPQPL